MLSEYSSALKEGEKLRYRQEGNVNNGIVYEVLPAVKLRNAVEIEANDRQRRWQTLCTSRISPVLCLASRQTSATSPRDTVKLFCFFLIITERPKYMTSL